MKFVALLGIAAFTLASCQASGIPPSADGGSSSSSSISTDAEQGEEASTPPTINDSERLDTSDTDQGAGAVAPQDIDDSARVGTFLSTFEIGGKGSSPRAMQSMAASNDGSKLFITRTRGNLEEILSVDVEALEIFSATGNVLLRPRRQFVDGLAVSDDAMKIFVLLSEERTATLLVIDSVTGELLEQVKLQDNYAVLYKLGSNLYTSSWNFRGQPRPNPHQLAQINIDKITSIRELEVGYANIRSTCALSDEIALVSDEDSDARDDVIFLPIKVSAFQVREIIKIGNAETVLAVNPTCTSLIKEQWFGDGLFARDIKAGTDTVPAAESATDTTASGRLAAYSPDGSLVYWLIERDAIYGLAVTDAKTLEAKGEIMADRSVSTGESEAKELVLSADGSRAFVLLRGKERREGLDSVMTFDLVGS